MWGNLADRLGAKDLNATLQRIGQAVAPPPPGNDDDDDDDDDYYDDDDDEEDDDDASYDSEEEYDDDEEDDNGRKKGLGLVGILSRVGGVVDQSRADETVEAEEELEAKVEMAMQPAALTDQGVMQSTRPTRDTTSSSYLPPTTTNATAFELEKEQNRREQNRREQDRQNRLREEEEKKRERNERLQEEEERHRELREQEEKKRQRNKLLQEQEERQRRLREQEEKKRQRKERMQEQEEIKRRLREQEEIKRQRNERIQEQEEIKKRLREQEEIERQRKERLQVQEEIKRQRNERLQEQEEIKRRLQEQEEIERQRNEQLQKQKKTRRLIPNLGVAEPKEIEITPGQKESQRSKTEAELHAKTEKDKPSLEDNGHSQNEASQKAETNEHEISMQKGLEAVPTTLQTTDSPKRNEKESINFEEIREKTSPEHHKSEILSHEEIIRHRKGLLDGKLRHHQDQISVAETTDRLEKDKTVTVEQRDQINANALRKEGEILLLPEKLYVGQNGETSVQHSQNSDQPTLSAGSHQQQEKSETREEKQARQGERTLSKDDAGKGAVVIRVDEEVQKLPQTQISHDFKAENTVQPLSKPNTIEASRITDGIQQNSANDLTFSPSKNGIKGLGSSDQVDDQLGESKLLKANSVDFQKKAAESERKREDLEEQLGKTKQTIAVLQLQASTNKEEVENMMEKTMLAFHEKEARLLQATSEENQLGLLQLEQRLQSEIHTLEEHIAKERKQFIRQQEKYRQMIESSESRADKAEAELRTLLKQHESQLAHTHQQEMRAVRMAEDKVAQTMAILDERDDEISDLKVLVKSLESSMNEHAEGAEDAEQEVEELQTENETLQHHAVSLQAECAELKARLSMLESDVENLGGIQMELTMLREERDRERAKHHVVAESAITSHSEVEIERDAAIAEGRDLKRQLAAALADFEVARADKARIMTANDNLQNALEAFQDERQAEMDLLDQRKVEEIQVIKSAHEEARLAIRQAHEAEMKQVQNAAGIAVENVMNKVRAQEADLEKVRNENSQMRRSLDEAIHRLQTTQEDVIDRTLMKNILLDWCTLKDKPKRHDVLELMANVLHFSEEEKEKVHLTHFDIRSKMVEAFTAPLPPSKADVEHLEGSNVQEKWVNFLLAETDDGN